MPCREAIRTVSATTSAPILDVETAVVGTWTLLSWESRAADGRATHPIGPDPVGRLVYSADGFMSLHIAGAERPTFGSPDPRAGTEAQLVHAFRTFVAYSGRYRIDGTVMVHDVDLSLFPDWVGAEQRRHVELRGDELVLATSPIETDGEPVVNELRWRRSGSAGDALAAPDDASSTSLELSPVDLDDNHA